MHNNTITHHEPCSCSHSAVKHSLTIYTPVTDDSLEVYIADMLKMSLLVCYKPRVEVLFHTCGQNDRERLDCHADGSHRETCCGSWRRSCIR